MESYFFFALDLCPDNYTGCLANNADRSRVEGVNQKRKSISQNIRRHFRAVDDVPWRLDLRFRVFSQKYL